MKLRFERHDHFFNQKVLIQKFIAREMELNQHLLNLHSCSERKELQCRGFSFFNSTMPIRVKHNVNNNQLQYGYKNERIQKDPIVII